MRVQFPPYDAKKLICEAIEELFGEKCSDFDPECATCAAWQEWERLATGTGLPFGHVKIPENYGEAKSMILVAERWLKDHPERS